MKNNSRDVYNRFRGFLPVAVDIETGGTDPAKNPLLEIAVVFFDMRENGIIISTDEICEHIVPFPASVIDEEALKINQIDPGYPLRFPKEEKEVLSHIFTRVQKQVDENGCRRAIMVGHNAPFDLAFLNCASSRCQLRENNPFHTFSVLDTVSLAALAYGQTILAVACEKAGLDFNTEEAHSALYDAQKTAELFCTIVNTWLFLGGWDESTGIKNTLEESNTL